MRPYARAIPQPIHRIGYSKNPWSLPDWKYGPFDGRWDDPKQEYRVRYVAFTRVGAFIERIARYRPDLALLDTPAIDGGGHFPVPGLPDDWFRTNVSGTATLDYPADNGIVDFASGDGIADAHAAVAAAARAAGHPLRDYDASTLLSGNPRSFTQALSRYVYDAGFAGIVYCSRFAPEERCVALFENRHEVHGAQMGPITRGDEHLLHACDLHHIPHPPLDVPQTIRGYDFGR